MLSHDRIREYRNKADQYCIDENADPVQNEGIADQHKCGIIEQRHTELVIMVSHRGNTLGPVIAGKKCRICHRADLVKHRRIVQLQGHRPEQRERHRIEKDIDQPVLRVKSVCFVTVSVHLYSS